MIRSHLKIKLPQFLRFAVLVAFLASLEGRTEAVDSTLLPASGTTNTTNAEQLLGELVAASRALDTTGSRERLRDKEYLDRIEKVFLTQEHAALAFDEQMGIKKQPDPCGPSKNVYAGVDASVYNFDVHLIVMFLHLRMCVENQDLSRIERNLPIVSGLSRAHHLAALARISDPRAPSIAARWAGGECSEVVTWRARVTLATLIGCASDEKAMAGMLKSWNISGEDAERFKTDVRKSMEPFDSPDSGG